MTTRLTLSDRPDQTLFESRDLEVQRQLYDERVRPMSWTRGLNWTLSRQATMSVPGMPHPQRKEVERQHAGGVAGFVRERVDHVFRQLPVWSNYFWAVYVFGRYRRDRCPEYLERENFLRLLHGRERLMRSLPLPDGAVVAELGGGTGRCLELLGARLERVRVATVVDLCEPLLDVARARIADRPSVHAVAGDATTWRAPEPLDAVVLSYSPTMMPDWRAALENAVSQLAPGGVIAVADFYVSGPSPGAGLSRHGPLTPDFWPRWFAHDGVHLSEQHLPWLLARCRRLDLVEGLGTVPLLPRARVPNYLFVGAPRT